MAREKNAADWRAEAKRLREEVVDTKRQLAEAQEFHGQSGVISDDFINRTSLGHLRNKTWAAFTATIRGLPQSRIDLGYMECRTQSVADLLGDLYTLGISGPKGSPEDVERRKTAAQFLETKSFFAILSHAGAEYCERCMRFWGDVRPPRLLGRDPCVDGRGHLRGNEGYDEVRVRYIGEAAECYYRPAVWTLFARAPEVVMMPSYRGGGGSTADEEEG